VGAAGVVGAVVVVAVVGAVVGGLVVGTVVVGAVVVAGVFSAQPLKINPRIKITIIRPNESLFIFYYFSLSRFRIAGSPSLSAHNSPHLGDIFMMPHFYITFELTSFHHVSRRFSSFCLRDSNYPEREYVSLDVLQIIIQVKSQCESF
jgi:hypothetical protein